MMGRSRFVALAAGLWLVTAGLPEPAMACGGNPVCTVKDPTGTPLNIRASPGGRIIGTARNGTKLEFIDHQEVNGRRWARVARYEPNAAILSMEPGYVFGAYLRCQMPLAQATPEVPAVCVVNDPTATPLNIRATPNGAIIGTVRNGVTVRAMSVESHRGRPWALVERLAADNAVGWVYDPYLKCEEDGH
jgi:hypothetical protein